jgi:hypothetical protein
MSGNPCGFQISDALHSEVIATHRHKSLVEIILLRIA